MVNEKDKEKNTENIEPIRVSTILINSVLTLITKAWAFLGTISHPETKTVSRDLNESKLAIDAIDKLVGVLKEYNINTKEIEFELANLRLNYVSQRLKMEDSEKG